MTEVLGLPSGIELAPEPRVKDIDFEPDSDTYAHEPLAQGVDLWDMFTKLTDKYGVRFGNFSATVFRSKRRPDADNELLGNVDYDAHLQASRYPGFVYYFKGPVDKDGYCLSFCIWETAEDGALASRDPTHLKAMKMAGMFYESADVEFLDITYTPEVIEVAPAKDSSEYYFLEEENNLAEKAYLKSNNKEILNLFSIS